MRYFQVKEDRFVGFSGSMDAVHQWGLPGLRNCPGCKATWGDNSKAYPSVDLTSIASQSDFLKARPEPIEEYERLRDLVRPFLPPGAMLEPGTALGPLIGRAQGRFGALAAPVPWWPLVQRDAYEKLQAEGLHGLKGVPARLRFRQREAPVLLEWELLPVGRAHVGCLPPRHAPPCPRCHRHGLTLPNPLLLDSATLPGHLDFFRLEDFSTLVLCTERFVGACQRLGLEGFSFEPVATC